ncbi:hypothetical protein ILUMI_16259 [Ignelater luminosus]|uniref:Helicase superfamily 3 single-stranded DNA/RNA virus domain-containing protein n=1 Tax=Ignelater luminosus TaxID=2038154 RepID=A0A8K0CUS6_IGNLU|nr:hypothetical protein ILUMI_16259 [Ignelater luminosus]
MEHQFYHPFSVIVAGPSGCGKSYFVLKLLKNASRMCNTNFEKVLWFYDEWQPLYKDLSEIVEFQQGLSDMRLFDGGSPNLITIHDLMRESNADVVDIFTKGCHHRNLRVFFITQNIFHLGKGQRDIFSNAHYIICFKNPRDGAQIRHQARQICPEDSKFLQEAYHDATADPHGYLLFDLKQSTPNTVRYRTSIFSEDGSCFVYVPRKRYKYKSIE